MRKVSRSSVRITRKDTSVSPCEEPNKFKVSSGVALRFSARFQSAERSFSVSDYEVTVRNDESKEEALVRAKEEVDELIESVLPSLEEETDALVMHVAARYGGR